MIRKLLSVALFIFLLVSLTRCAADLGIGMIKEVADYREGIRQELGELWDAFLEEVKEWSESFAIRFITNDLDLIGNREKGAGHYIGTYEADDRKFSEKKSIFGSISFKRQGRSDLYAACSLAIPSGKTRLYRMAGWDEIILTDISKKGISELTIHAGENLIVLDGTQFAGSLTLTVNPENGGGGQTYVEDRAFPAGHFHLHICRDHAA